MLRCAVFAAVMIGPLLGLLACGSDGLLQGEPYDPEGLIPIAPASERLEGGACDGGACDAGQPGVAPPPIGNGAVAPTNTCEESRAFGTLAGDSNSATLTVSGTCSEWVSFRATEESSSPLGKAMKVALTLDCKGGDFDLYVYYEPLRDELACDAPFASSVHPGVVDETVALHWGEGSVSNGGSDDRTISVAVIKNGGPCGPDGGSWTLTAEGNQ